MGNVGSSKAATRFRWVRSPPRLAWGQARTTLPGTLHNRVRRTIALPKIPQRHWLLWMAALTATACMTAPVQTGTSQQGETPSLGSDTWDADSVSADSLPPDTLHTDALTACPTTAPWGGNVLWCAVALDCQSGTEFCCNKAYYAHCTCKAGEPLHCEGGIDYCMGATTMCSYGCDLGYFKADGKCTNCGTIIETYTKGLAAILATEATCSSDSECGAISPSLCVTPCTVPVRLGHEASLTAAVADLATHLCPTPKVTKYCFQSAGCQVGLPRCVDGKCKLGAACDPTSYAVGDDCNDGNPCTVNDICSAPAQCAGKPRDCSDGNPCTVEECSLDIGGCTVPIPVSGVACAPGKLCNAGLCGP